ncbi:hypothetical protein DMH88_14090 [Escherichia coli]|nr:hypothetical protein [Escherichia coli]
MKSPFVLKYIIPDIFIHHPLNAFYIYPYPSAIARILECVVHCCSIQNPILPLRLALWSDGFFNKRTIISFNLLTI